MGASTTIVWLSAGRAMAGAPAVESSGALVGRRRLARVEDKTARARSTDEADRSAGFKAVVRWDFADEHAVTQAHVSQTLIAEVLDEFNDGVEAEGRRRAG